MENQSEIIDLGLNHINSNTLFLDMVFRGKKEETQEVLFDIQGSTASYNLDLMFVSLETSAVWVDASSSLFDLEQILPDIVQRKKTNASARIHRFIKDSVDITLLINSVRIVHHRTGKIMGTLYGGVILNDNLSLLEIIRNKTRSISVAVFESGDLIGASDRYGSKILDFIEKAREEAGRQKFSSGNGIIASNHRIHLFENPTSLEVVLAVTNKPFIDIKKSFQIKTIILISLSIVFFFISILIIKALTYPSIKKLINFSQDVIEGKTQTAYSPGKIVELNKIGHSMETMVASLKTANKEIQREMEGRRQTENTLETKEIHLKTLIRAIPDLIWLKDKEGKYLFCNSKFERFFGSKEEEITGKTDYDFVDKELADNFRAHDLKTIDKGEPRTNEEEVVFADDGHTEILETIKTPVYGPNNELIGVLGIARDITDRKEHFDRFRTVMDSLEALVYVADMETYEILFVNKYGKDIWGDLTGKTCWQTLQTDQAGPCSFCTNDQLLDSNLNATGPVIWEVRNTVDNEWYECRDQAITWLDGRMVRMEIAANITQRKETEKQKTILEEKLRQAQKMEAIGTLAGGIAHDFNNILFPLVGFTEMLQEDLPQDSPLQENVSEVLLAALRAKELVKQILTFSRQSDQEFKPVRLQSVLKEALNLLGSSIPTTIDIQTDIDPQCEMVIADPTQIHQIIMNLATNAFHAMQESGGQLSISLKQTQIESNPMGFTDLIPGKYALLKVIDTGSGIKKEVIEKIFDPYFTTKPKDKGTGLGLSVVKGIAQSCNGDIHVYSELEKGTEVHVYLPVIKRLADNPPSDQTLPIQGGTERILLVDDEGAILKMEKLLLERLGYHVTEKNDSNKALKSFENHPEKYDLIITDMTMPNMTGDRLAKALILIRSDIPIIICTGFSENINEIEAMDIGVKGFLMKPVVKADMANMVRKVLDEAKVPSG